MNYEELKNTKVRMGDLLYTTKYYSSLSPSTWAGPIVSTQPILVYPWSGNNGYWAPDENEDELKIVRLPLILRIINILRSYKTLASNRK